MTNVISKYQTSLTILKSKLTTCMQTNLKRLLVNDLESDLIEVICCNSWLQTPDKSKQLFPPQTIYHYTYDLVSMSYFRSSPRHDQTQFSYLGFACCAWDSIFISETQFSYLGPACCAWDPMEMDASRLVGSNGNQLTPKSFSASSSPSLSSSSITH